MVETEELREIISSHHEWLLIRDAGRTFPLGRDEIDVEHEGGKARFGFLDDQGFHTWRLNGFTHDDGEIAIDVAGAYSRKRETMRLIPRTPAAELAAEIEIARLKRANEVGRLIETHHPGSKLGRVALNEENGRFAEIIFESSDSVVIAAIADVTESLTVESIFTAALAWLEKLGTRKRKPVNQILIVCEKRQAKNAQKLHALLSEQWRNRITVAEVVRKGDESRLAILPKRKMSDLWREKAAKLALPEQSEISQTAASLVESVPEKIDMIHSRQGETLRFAGLPFARVRTMMGKEKAWFGVGRSRRILTDENYAECAQLTDELNVYRSASSPNTRHEYYRTASEAWLESILRRNIGLLDGNLILSPVYNQFRSSNDKIDMLALRRDGRLVIIELKTQPDREMVFQAADYWRKIELQRRRGVLAAVDLFEGREILDKPALIYLAAPAWSFHRDFEFFARAISPQIELWRFELHENWRQQVKVVARQSYSHG